MLGRRLDRYVTSFFVWHFVLCLVAVLGLYIVVDTFSKLDEFVGHDDPMEQVRWIVTYHLYQIPVLVSQFVPIVALLGGIISLGRLASYNELNAMKAAGVSMYRTLTPVFLCSLVIGGLAAVDQEVILPYLDSDIRRVRVEALRGDEVEDRIFVYDREHRTTVLARRLDPAVEGKELSRIEAVADPALGPDGKLLPTGKLCARKAIWATSWLFLFDGHATDAAGATQPFAVRMLRADQRAALYNPPPRPPSRLADGAAAYAVRARADLPARQFALPAEASAPGGGGAALRQFTDPLEGRGLSVKFASVGRAARYRMFFDGQVTGAYAGRHTEPPLAVQVALWRRGKWWGRAQTFTEVHVAGGPPRRQLIVYDGHALPISATPVELVQTRIDPTLKSFAELERLGREIPIIRQRIQVLLHGRLSFPLASFVLLIVAIPLLFQQEGGKSTWLGVGMALLLSVAFYFVTYAFQFLGQNPAGLFKGVPALAAWLPIAIFGAAGLILLAHMDT